ncbi:MAG: glutathione S-transferase N-terminal domain-containing protein [Eggerthellaceae bacterium]|nr:glutathione S-transferase N-terminal domain-containing protein [Eggerthellaceae bacterium]
MAQFEDMYLYVKPGCPFCMKVDRFLEQEGIEMEHRSVLEGTNADDLRALGGKVQSPCLVVDGKAMYESDDIIAYLRTLL